MQVILLEKVANLGNLGDIVKVKDGFGRNFLIPQGKAKRATDSNKAEFEARRAELEKQQSALLDAAKERAKALAGFNLAVTQKAGVDGKLFGSVTNTDIAEGLTAKNIKVVKAEIRMPNGPLKTVGQHQVTIALHHDVTVDITIDVIGEPA
ncbi:50S ribosomal protein L9 [Candidatus Methylopumilus rimovensis]|jgi:large subunit ribosomal protein L9|uniref:Large ribosomal subunit protein bL9 n=1 Tax=Candidatus Methylopumilus rimovensis TaxID=2588535 RepID=A0AAF1D7M1_9PROT|nr:50S ribosomal protein L9 [Candidatus Methylopumilus rimovensis]QDD13513.1 50S ribosomal protein L9 [Candidatus Methylopumilus rimovensis]